MSHRQEIDSIIAQVMPWPAEEQMALAQEILRAVHLNARQPAPRQTLQRALGIARGSTTPPDDATVREWTAEHRLRKHG